MSELVVPSRDALAEGITAHTRLSFDGRCSCGHTVELGRSFNAHVADALLAAGVVRPLPDVETVALVIRGVKDWPNEPWAKQREQARAVLALFEGGSK